MDTTSKDECSPGILPKYEYGSSPKGKVLVVQFPDPDNQFHNSTLDALRAKTEKSFENIGYEPLKWNGYEPKKANRKTFLDELKEVAKELPPSESFVMIVISSQKNGKILMTYGEELEMEDVYLKFDAKSCKNLKYKPKLFIFDIHPYEVKRQDAHQSAQIPVNISEIPEFSEKVPLEADMLVVCSIEGSRNIPEPTAMVSPSPSFINALTEVLENDFKKEHGHKDILELMVDVSERVLQQNGPESPIPMVLSTLTSQYYLKKNISEQQ